MELTSGHLGLLCCEVTLFNRQRWKIHDQLAQRIIIDSSGKQIVLYTKSLMSYLARDLFFSQIKQLWFDGKLIAYRGCATQALLLSNNQYAKLVKRQRLLKDARISYENYLKKQKKAKNKKKITKSG
ncbi:type III secretion system protein PrgR [Enterococcus faecium]|uniref:Type III secretion system protein PrgR n=1 Tax=Enterococcus faecium TaxID=1352 RepID=A0A9X4B491_ENTFC|nr:type III secretion system protein PrgR [Enterococcus faecium]MDC4248101.1 type III secretion system protein PrgR [Enterococcus faecium]